MPEISQYRRGLAAAVLAAGWNRDQLDAFQSRALRALVRHAFERVPFYRDLFVRHGIDPAEIRGIQDLRRLPLARRAEMQERPDTDLVARGIDPRGLVENRTSGSTGAPFSIRRAWFEERLLNAVRRRQDLKLGRRLTDVKAGITGFGSSRRPKRLAHPWYTRFGLLRRNSVSCLLPAREILDRLKEIQPDIMGGYPGSLAWIAGEATEEDRRRIRPRFITTGAETLTPEMRRQIMDCFGVPVHDFYSAHEFNMIAYQCRETGLYHVSECSVLVEVLRDGEPAGAGESGQLVGTALHSFAMPFIRYPLGDVVTRGPLVCPCGAPNATLESIQGRMIDRFPLPNGETIHPYHLVTPLVRSAPWLRRYQIVQEKLDRIVVRVVALPGRDPTGEDLGVLRASMTDTVGAGVEIILEVVKDLPAAESGKFRPYYSLVRGEASSGRASAAP